VHIDYGTVLAAGFVYRQDHGPDELVVGEAIKPHTRAFSAAGYRRIGPRVQRNLRYIGNLCALWHWYQRVRLPLAAGEAQLTALYRRAAETVAGGIEERIKRLEQLAGYMPQSIAQLEPLGSRVAGEIADQRSFAERWPTMATQLRAFAQRPGDDASFSGRLVDQLGSGQDYVAAIQALSPQAVMEGTAWLQQIVDQTVAIGGQPVP
jgi:hypothetical protein